MEPFFDQIDRMLNRVPPLALFLFPVGQDKWLALLTLSAQHAWIIEQEITRDPTRNRISDYLQTPLFPATYGRTPVEALQALNSLVAEIEDSEAIAWATSVFATYGRMTLPRARGGSVADS